VHARRELVPASAALCFLLSARYILVETDSNLGGPLKDMEELSERKPEQGEDYGGEYDDSRLMTERPGNFHKLPIAAA
jgi:hypothetical protein